MTTDVLTIEESEPLVNAVALLEKHHFKRLPVTRQGRLIGILSRADLMRTFLGKLPCEEPAANLSDADIQKHIDQEMLRHPWITRSAIQVTVVKGTVDLDGVVTSDAMRDALRVMAENIPGVVGVKDKLALVEPTTGAI